MPETSVFYHLILDFDISSYWKTGPCLKSRMIDFILNELPMILFDEIGSTCQMKQVSAFFFHSFFY